MTTPKQASGEVEELKQRVRQLENEFKLKQWAIPPSPDPELGPNEWHAYFADYQDLSLGTISKTAPSCLAGPNSSFKVVRASSLAARDADVRELVEAAQIIIDKLAAEKQLAEARGYRNINIEFGDLIALSDALAKFKERGG